MFVQTDQHGFGERVQLTKTLKVSNQVERIKVRYVPEPENENVKRLREIWNNIKKK